MLVISRKVGEQIVIDGNITVTLLETRKGGVKLGISAPREVPVHREEIAELLSSHRPALEFTECA